MLISDISVEPFFGLFFCSFICTDCVNTSVLIGSRTARHYKDNPNCTDTAAAYVMRDLTGTPCSLTKAFLFKTVCGKLPENPSLRADFCSAGQEELNQEQRLSDCVIAEEEDVTM